MKIKSGNIINKKKRMQLLPLLTVGGILVIWQACSMLGVVPRFMLPAPTDVFKAFAADFHILLYAAGYTLSEALIGLAVGVALGFSAAAWMDRYESVYHGLLPLLVITQTVPTVAIAPLLILWFGFGMLPKVILIATVTFFPIAISLLEGFRSVDRDTVGLMRVMGASRLQIFRYVKLPNALGSFFASLRIAVSYAIVGAVISEWLGGFNGLGVYMTRVKKSFAFDKMFAVIFFISLISLLLMAGVDYLGKRLTPWRENNEEQE